MRTFLSGRLLKVAVCVMIMLLAMFAAGGGATSLAAGTDVTAPTIDAFPFTEMTAQPGGRVSIGVTAHGDSLSYQWYVSTRNSTDSGTAIAGATGDSYFFNVWAAGTTCYYCVVTNTDDSASGATTATATSDIMQVTVPLINAAAPDIRHLPNTEMTAQPGNRVSVGVTAHGDSLSYQWYCNTTGSTDSGTAIAGATGDSYDFDVWAAGTTYYYCVVTNTNNNVNGATTATATSDIMQVTVPLINAAAPDIRHLPNTEMTAQPGNRVSVGVTAHGDSLSYQWYCNTTGSTDSGTAIAGATGDSYDFDVWAAGTTYYYCVVTNTNNNVNGATTATATSDIMQVTVPRIDAAAPGIGTQPAAVSTVNVGAGLTLSIGVSVGTGRLSYQWYGNTVNSNSGGSLITGATGPDYTVPTGTVGTLYYYCVVTNTDSAATGYQTAMTATSAAAVNVIKITPTVRVLPSASDIQVIGKLSASKLTGGSGSAAGTFAWTNSDTVVTKSGSYEATFTPSDPADYNTCTCMVSVTVTPLLTNSQSQVSLDLTGVTMPVDVTSVSLGSTAQSSDSSAYSMVVKLIGQNNALGNLNSMTVYDLELLDQNGNPITKFTGKIKVKVPIPAGMSGGMNVFWYNPAAGTLTDMNAVQENGDLVFETSHFSDYAIAQLSSPMPAPNTVPAPIQNPKTGSDTGKNQYVQLALLGMGSMTLVVIVRKWAKYRVKK